MAELLKDAVHVRLKNNESCLFKTPSEFDSTIRTVLRRYPDSSNLTLEQLGSMHELLAEQAAKGENTPPAMLYRALGDVIGALRTSESLPEADRSMAAANRLGVRTPRAIG